MDHLAEAKKFANYADTGKLEWAQVNAQVATAHAGIALVELLAKRLPLPAETASARHVRLQKEEHDGV